MYFEIKSVKQLAKSVQHANKLNLVYLTVFTLSGLASLSIPWGKE